MLELETMFSRGRLMVKLAQEKAVRLDDDESSVTTAMTFRLNESDNNDMHVDRNSEIQCEDSNSKTQCEESNGEIICEPSNAEISIAGEVRALQYTIEDHSIAPNTILEQGHSYELKCNEPAYIFKDIENEHAYSTSQVIDSVGSVRDTESSSQKTHTDETDNIAYTLESQSTLSDSFIEVEYDMDDSVRDPDYVPTKKDLMYESSSDDADTGNTEIVHDGEIDHEEIIDETEELVEDESPKKKKKRRKNNESNYEKNVNKRLRMEGKAYKGMTKRDEKWTYGTDRNEIILTPRSCSKRCDRSKVLACSKFTDDDRQDIFSKFWTMLNWDERKVYVNSLITPAPVGKKTIEGQGRRSVTYRYTLKKNDTVHVVCKNMFLSTLGIGEKTVYDWLKGTEHGIPDKPQRKSRDPAEGHRKARENAEQYLESLPKLPSHYCRSTSSKLYLEPVFASYSELYTEYKNNCTDNDQLVVCYTVFINIFNDMNLSLFTPKKDQCDVCCGHETGNVSDIDYNKHIEKKDSARDAKRLDKERCENDDSGACVVITMDVQSVLLSPRLQASAMYYKTKLACHNFTVYDLKSKDVTCYFWHEGEGDLTSNSFASCITDYIETLTADGNVKEIIIFSDGCCYQNRNVGLSNAVLKLAVDKEIKIEQKYLEKGHTQMEVDSVHSVIERKLKKKPIYVPYNYVEVLSSARPSQPYKVKYITHDFFRNYSELSYYSSIRPGVRVGDRVVTDIRVLSYSQQGDIKYACSHGDELQEFPRKAKKEAVESGQTVARLHSAPLAIKNTKFTHLQQLKSVIPKDFHAFYDNLKHN